MPKRSFSTVIEYIWASPATSLGIFAGFIAYPVESMLQRLRGKHPYLDNRLEVSAAISSGTTQGSLHATTHIGRRMKTVF